jgi:hypothetical protein
MCQLPSHLWNLIAEKSTLRTDWARWAFALDEEQRDTAMEQQADWMRKAGYSNSVVVSYQTVLPLLLEHQAISRFNSQTEALELRGPLPEILDANEAVLLMKRDRMLSEQDEKDLRRIMTFKPDGDGEAERVLAMWPIPEPVPDHEPRTSANYDRQSVYKMLRDFGADPAERDADRRRLVDLFNAMTFEERDDLLVHAALVLMRRRSVNKCLNQSPDPAVDWRDELALDAHERVASQWPSTWPGKIDVDLTNVGDPSTVVPAWFEDAADELLGTTHRDGYLAAHCADFYIEDARNQGMGGLLDPRGAYDNDTVMFESFLPQFEGFIRQWRRNVIDALNSDTPMPEPAPAASPDHPDHPDAPDP